MSYNTDLYLDYLQTPQLYEMLFVEFSIIVMPNYKDIAHHNIVKAAKKRVNQLTQGVAGDARRLQKIDAQIAKHKKAENLGAIKRLKMQRQGVLDAMKKKITLAKKIKVDTRKSAEHIRKHEAGRKKLNKAIAKTATKVKDKITGAKTAVAEPVATKTSIPAPELKATTKKVVSQLKTAIPEPAETAKVAKKAGSEFGAAVKKAAKTTGKIGLIAGASAAAAYGGYKIYQRYLSQAAKKCKGKGGAERSLCIKQYMQARRKD